jgi:hypothetical protein
MYRFQKVRIGMVVGSCQLLLRIYKGIGEATTESVAHLTRHRPAPDFQTGSILFNPLGRNELVIN